MSTDIVVEWAKTKLERTVDPSEPRQFLSALKQYADSGSFPLLVLDRYPVNAGDSAAFLGYFGEPKVVVSVNTSDEARLEEYRATPAGEGDEREEEEIVAQLAKGREEHEAMFKVFEDKCAPCCMSVQVASVKSPEELSMAIRKRLRPRAYVIIAPSGRVEFSRLMADAISTMKGDSGRPKKYTVIDCAKLFSPSGHSEALEDRLYKASFTADTNSLPVPMRAELFSESFAQSSNPMGTFLVTNFPTPTTSASSPTVRDQFCMLESICSIMGIVHVTFSEGPWVDCCGTDTDEFMSYTNSDGKVGDSILVQFGAAKLCSCVVERGGDPAEAARRLAVDFLGFQDKAEQAC